MKRRRVVRLVALSSLAVPFAGCSNEAAEPGDEDDGNETESDDGEDADEDTDPADEQDGETFSGTGNEVLEDVSIEGGLTVVDATHEGEDDFQVRLIPDGDDRDGGGALFADASGSHEGQTALHLNDGTYRLSVVADGDWTVAVQQPRETSGERPPISISGTGNEVHGPFEFDGTHEPTGEYEGTEISVNILSTTSTSRQFVFHEDSIDNPPAFTYEDVGYIEIKSDGEWSVEIE